VYVKQTLISNSISHCWTCMCKRSHFNPQKTLWNSSVRLHNFHVIHWTTVFCGTWNFEPSRGISPFLQNFYISAECFWIRWRLVRRGQIVHICWVQGPQKIAICCGEPQSPTVEFGELARGIWKNLLRKTEVLIHVISISKGLNVSTTNKKSTEHNIWLIHTTTDFISLHNHHQQHVTSSNMIVKVMDCQSNHAGENNCWTVNTRIHTALHTNYEQHDLLLAESNCYHPP